MRIPNYQPPKSIQQDRPCPEGFCPKSFMALLYGSKGSGKTNILLHIIEEYQKYKFFDKIYVFSPTHLSDPKQQLIKDYCQNVKYYGSYTNETFTKVLEEIKTDLEELKEYEKKMKLWKKFKKKGHAALSDEELLQIYMFEFEEPPKPKFDHLPYTLIVFDDQIGNAELYKPQARGVFPQFAILHRHLLCSVIFSVQIYRGGVPKCVRSNLDWWVLTKNKSISVMKEVAEDLTSYATEEQIIKMWEEATDEAYSWFCINLMNKEFRFTKNFDEKIL